MKTRTHLMSSNLVHALYGNEVCTTVYLLRYCFFPPIPRICTFSNDFIVCSLSLSLYPYFYSDLLNMIVTLIMGRKNKINDTIVTLDCSCILNFKLLSIYSFRPSSNEIQYKSIYYKQFLSLLCK